MSGFELKKVLENAVNAYYEIGGIRLDTVKLASKRLFLKALSLNELSHINNNEMNKSGSLIEPEAIFGTVLMAIAKKIKKMQSVHEDNHSWYTYWLIIDKKTEKGIGFIGFKGLPDEDGYSEVGYSISSNYRRKGLMTEALRTLMVWASETPSCKGIVANVLKTNIGSIKVLSNCTFQLANTNEQENSYLHIF
jgi:RimJ/RimL family protein N-acetyltransferase